MVSHADPFYPSEIPPADYINLAKQALKNRGVEIGVANKNIQQQIQIAKIFDLAIKDLQKQEIGFTNLLQKKPHHFFWQKMRGVETSHTAKKNKANSIIMHKKREVQLAIQHLKELRQAQILPGVQKGMELLKLQEILAIGNLSPAQRKHVCDEIAARFESTQSYQEMYDLRVTVDHIQAGTSQLHKLVYDDVDVETCHRILKAINENVKQGFKDNPQQIKFNYMIYSDIDDTIKGSLNDRQSNIGGFYPGALEFYKQMGLAKPQQEGNSSKTEEGPEKGKGVAASSQKNQTEAAESGTQVKLTFLSARPKIASDLWNVGMKKELPADTHFFSLYGSTPSILKGVKYYVSKKIVDFVSSLADWVLGPHAKERVKSICRSSEANTFISFALEKRKNIDRDLLLRPETRPIMVGDCGEGDLIFLLMKNSGVPSPQSDDRIPAEYIGEERWHDSLSSPGNPTNKPLFLGFAHAISSPTDYEVRPDPKYQDDYSRLNTQIFSNYVDNALHCFEKGVFDRNAADKVVNEAKNWIKNHQKEIDLMLKKEGITLAEALSNEEVLNRLSPALKYRIKLMASINQYDKYVPLSEDLEV